MICHSAYVWYDSWLCQTKTKHICRPCTCDTIGLQIFHSLVQIYSAVINHDTLKLYGIHYILVLMQDLKPGVPWTNSPSDCCYTSTDWVNPAKYLTLRWRPNGRNSVSYYQPHDCLLNRLFRRRSKKTSNHRITGLCVGHSPGTGEFPAQMAHNAENVSIWWRHHGLHKPSMWWLWTELYQYCNGTKQLLFTIYITLLKPSGIS